jgi:hypothetical protein
MAQSGYTPLKIYASGTAAAQPLAADLAFGELAINYADGKIFYKNSGGTVSAFSSGVTTISFGSTGLTPSTATGGVVSVAGTLAVANGGTGVTSSTGTNKVVLSTAPTFDTTTLFTGIAAPTFAEGLVWYDSTAKALSYYNDASTAVVHIGQDTQTKVINNTGSTIPNGSPVYITGTTSGFTYPNIALAKADIAGTSAVIGLTNGSIANGATGYVTSNGGIDNVNTGTFTVGQVLYLSPFSAGQLQNTVPATGLIVQVGVVTFVNSSTGKIYVKQTQPLNLATSQGGTGVTSYAAGDTLYYSSGTALSKLSIGTAYQINAVNAGATAPAWQGLSSLLDNVFTASAQGTLIYRGASNWVALAPGAATTVLTSGGAGANLSWAAGSGGVTSISFGSTGLTPNTASTGVVSVAGTLGAGFGGTGLATYTAGDVIYASAATTFNKLSIGTAFQINAVNAGATAPSYQGISSILDNALAASAQGTILYRGATTWTALAPGTSGFVLSTGGAAANPSWIAASGGLTGFTSALNVAAPNATNNVSSLSASGGTASQWVAIVPKGLGGIIAQVPDSTVTGGNVRGQQAIDFQISRGTAAQVASGTASACLSGDSNSAISSYSVVLGGTANTSSATYSLAHGNNSTANSSNGVAFGGYASTRAVAGFKVFSPDSPIASALGVTQMGVLTVGVQTVDATPTILRSNTAAAASTNQYYVPLNGISAFTILVSCGITGASNAKAWEFKGAAKKGSTDNTVVFVGALSKNVLGADAGASTWDVAVTANTTTGAITITATGQAATTIRWSATVIATEVTY